MQIFDSGKVYNFMKMRWAFFILSLAFFIGSIGYMFVKGLNYGIDFSGGTLIQIKYDRPAPLGEIRQKLSGTFEGVSVTEFGSSDEVIVRYLSSSDTLSEDPGVVVSTLLKETGNFEIRRVDIVGPKVGDELRQKGVMAICVSLALILIYIAFRFEWRFALAAILGEIHDVLIVVGLIAVLRLQVNLDTLAALLTILGYSLNDTIVIFDRIREDVAKSKSTDINRVVNEAVSATLSRTLMTSLSTLFVVLILFFWGGDMIHDFSLIMLAGVIIGCYSSVFICAPMLGWFGFNVNAYRKFLAEKEAKRREKAQMRAMYEKGQV